MQRVNPSSARSSARRGFTLIELLVVIFIIIVLVAITVPALASVRKSARVTETRGFMQGLATAIQTFELEKKSLPGYFSARDMGNAQNETRGFSGMQNVMLDLAGGWQTAASTGYFEMGPTAQSTVYVNPDLVGAPGSTGKQYFTPTAKNWRKQDGTEGGERTGSIADHARLPELVDSFGAPIIAWSEDSSGPRKITQVSDFARINSGNTGADGAKFYRASNAAFLDNARVGTRRIVQSESMLVAGGNDQAATTTMMGILGNPGSPKSVRTSNTDDTAEEILPTSARGGISLHSAGVDGVFFSRTDKGAAACDRIAGQQVIFFGQNFLNPLSNPSPPDAYWVDSQGRQSSLDAIAGFDDIIQATGN